MDNWIPDLPGFEQPEPPSLDDEPKEVRALNAGNNSAREQDSNIPKGWKPTLEKPMPVIRCTGTIRNGDRTGERCGRWSIMGHDKCMVHGGHLPNVQAAAQKKVEAAKLRLIEDADLAVDTLFELLQGTTADNVKLGAAKEILDRAGVKGAIDVNVEVSHVNPSEDILKKLQIMRERITAEPEEEIVDAEDLTDEGEKQANAPLHVNSAT